METSQELLHEVSRRFREGRVGIAMIDSLQARDTKFIQQLKKNESQDEPDSSRE